MSGVKVFVDHGFSGRDFLSHFLASPEFTNSTLKKILPSAKSSQGKDGLVNDVVCALDSGVITENDILLAYIAQPKQWLSFQLGNHLEEPNLADSTLLLRNFGEEKWYGAIFNKERNKKWYIRVHKVPNPSFIGVGEARTLDRSQNIRWMVAAEIGAGYISLHWNGFTSSIYEDNDETLKQNQFTYWKYIPKFFDELKELFKGEWEHSNLHTLVLTDLWDKYLNKELGGFKYKWQHLRIRAEASGVALNARSAGSSDIDVRGLQALSRQLASSAIESLGIEISDDSAKFSDVENAVLRTLIHKWGTKSYEFRLDRLSVINANKIQEGENKKESIFKAHCYFGAKAESENPDALVHLLCSIEYGGSTGALDFLINEIELGEKDDSLYF